MSCLSIGVKPVAPRAAPKPRLVSGRKPAARAGGLGVKKMSKQVDASLFDQAPEEPAPPAAAAVSLQQPAYAANVELFAAAAAAAAATVVMVVITAAAARVLSHVSRLHLFGFLATSQHAPCNSRSAWAHESIDVCA